MLRLGLGLDECFWRRNNQGLLKCFCVWLRFRPIIKFLGQIFRSDFFSFSFFKGNICSLSGLLINSVSLQTISCFFSISHLSLSDLPLFFFSFLPFSFIIPVLFSPIPPDLALFTQQLYRQEKDALTLYGSFTKAGNINTHFFPIDQRGTSIFCSAHNISVSASYNAPLLITIRPNNNITEPVKHTNTHTQGHTDNTPLTDRFVSQNKHIERIVSEIIARMDRTHRNREGVLRKTDNLFWAQPNWPIHIPQALCGISSHWGSCWS